MGSAEVNVLCNIITGCDPWCHLHRPTYCILVTDTQTHTDTDKTEPHTARQVQVLKMHAAHHYLQHMPCQRIRQVIFPQ